MTTTTTDVPRFHGLRVQGLTGQPGDGCRSIKGKQIVPADEVAAYVADFPRLYPDVTEVQVSDQPFLLPFTAESSVEHGWEVLTEIGRRGQAGWPCTPVGVHISESSLWMDWACRELVADKAAMARLLDIQKAARLGHRLADEQRGWVAGETTYWADNSISTVWTAKDGGTKTVNDKPPSGDLCF